MHLEDTTESMKPLHRDPFFTVEGVVFEVLGGYGLAHVRTEDGSVYGLNRATAGIEFSRLHEGQRFRLQVADKFSRVLHAQPID